MEYTITTKSVNNELNNYAYKPFKRLFTDHTISQLKNDHETNCDTLFINEYLEKVISEMYKYHIKNPNITNFDNYFAQYI